METVTVFQLNFKFAALEALLFRLLFLLFLLLLFLSLTLSAFFLLLSPVRREKTGRAEEKMSQRARKFVK